jgi:UTP--glucose-1-phosphate uridylyltransferase
MSYRRYPYRHSTRSSLKAQPAYTESQMAHRIFNLPTESGTRPPTGSSHVSPGVLSSPCAGMGRMIAPRSSTAPTPPRTVRKAVVPAAGLGTRFPPERNRAA